MKKPVANLSRLDSNGSLDSDMDTDSLVNENIVVTQYDSYDVFSKQPHDTKPIDATNWFKNMDNAQLNHCNPVESKEPSPEVVTASSQAKVKSILKRTCSGTENDLTVVGFTPSVNFGIDSRTNVKDSIALANQRLGKTSKLDESNGEKKNVRFAANLTSENVIRIPSAGNEADDAPSANTISAPSNLNSLHTKTIQTLVIERQQPVVELRGGSNVVVSRRPVIKPKLSAAQQQMKKASIYDAAGITPPPVHPRQAEYESTPTTPNYASTPIVEKPPAHPNSVSPASTNSTLSIGNGSYALLGN